MALAQRKASVQEPVAEQVAVAEEPAAEQVAVAEEQKAEEKAPLSVDNGPVLKEESSETAKQ